MFGWDHDLNHRPRLAPGQAQFAAKLLDSLAHPANPHTDALRPELHYAVSNTLAVIANCNHQLTVAVLKSDPGILRSGVAEYIVERLLNDTEGRGFHLRRKSGELSRLHIQERFDATAFGEPFQKPAKRR